MNRIRINNIELRPIDSDSDYTHEIVKWFKNEYYQKEQEYIDKGFVFDGDSYKKDNLILNKNVFLKPQSCYTIAFVNRQNGVEYFPVGLRPIKLSKKNRKIFRTILKLIK